MKGGWASDLGMEGADEPRRKRYNRGRNASHEARSIVREEVLHDICRESLEGFRWAHFILIRLFTIHH